MKKLYFCFLTIVIFISLNLTTNAQLADSAWPMFHHDPQHTGRSPYNGPETPVLQWSYTTGGYMGWSSSALATNGTIYVGTWNGNELYALNPDGSEKWTFDTPDFVGNTPMIGADGTIYAGSDNGNFYAINPDGTQKWVFQTEDYWETNPTIGTNGTIYFDSNNFLYALNPDGTLKWTLPFRACSSPALGTDGTIYVNSTDIAYSEGTLNAIYPSGTLKWTCKTAKNLYSHPSIGADGTIFIMSQDNTLYAINPDGSKKWQNSYSSNFFGYAAIGSDGSIYVGSNYATNLYAINPDNGSLKWTFSTPDYDYVDSPVTSTDGTIYCGWDNTLYAVNPDGTLKWSCFIGDTISSTSVIGEDGTLYIGTYDYFYAFGEFEATPTPTPTITPTQSITKTPTATKTETPTKILTITVTPTYTLTQTITATSTLTHTPTDEFYKPTLSNGSVEPNLGNTGTLFKYVFKYVDMDGGDPWISSVYINGQGRQMLKENGIPGDALYYFEIYGSELDMGNNDYYFYFMDDEGNPIQAVLKPKSYGQVTTCPYNI